jgi:phage terminase large subunit GpA-like protein
MSATLQEFDAAYRRCWQTPEPLRPSQWAERYRVLSRRQSSRPGRWSNEAAPPLSGIMDLALHPRVRKLTIVKAAQVGVSEAIRNVIGYLADREPDPVLINLPNEQHGRGIFADRIIPLFEDTPRLRELMTTDGRDATLSQISLCNGFVLRLGWSGSATSLASHPVRFVLNDETDKFAPWIGNESDPISLAEVRTCTFANSTIVSTSTPTTRDGLIYRLWEAAPIRLEFHGCCPKCRQLQPLIFDRLKWETIDTGTNDEKAAALLASQNCWYECSKCGAKLSDSDRPAMLLSGCWTSADGNYRLFVDGREVGELPPESEVGLHLSALHSLAPKHRLAHIAAAFLKSHTDPLAEFPQFLAWRGV